MEFDIDQLNGMRTYDRDTLAQLVQDVEDGNESALKAYAIIKNNISLLQDALKQIEDIALDEASRYNEKTFSHEGFIFERRAGSRRFSFKNCTTWSSKQQELKDIESQLKAAYEARQKNLHAITDQGEVLELPEVTYTKDVLIVK